ncbi:MAG: s-methyl-5-thioribose-1-phosphate isomerase [Brevefilum sp.]|nr:s-methyl-5-thioribose-1-phosphate isomerase [Brevefilum sp.]
MDLNEINALLPFLLRRENVARYEGGEVVMCDRRQYPFEKTFFRCQDVECAARAIEDMVTQGGGPQYVALYAMAMLAGQVANRKAAQQREAFKKANLRLIKTRPTNTSMARHLENAMGVIDQALDQGQDVEAALLDWIEKIRDLSYEKHLKCGEYGASLIEDGDGILTMCFAETSLLMTLAIAKKSGKAMHVFTPETRPYLQGARLTAPSIHEIGVPVQIITDNMPAHVISQGKIQKYFTAADLITLDGHVVNKIGTFQNALAAHHHGVPYFVFTQAADKHKPNRESIEIEARNPDEIKMCRGVPTTSQEIDAYYPAFDITPPNFVAGVITQHGILSPYDLARYFG